MYYDIMKKIYGTTIYIGSSDLELKYGYFKVYVFQDVVDLKYIFALVYGDLNADDFYIRLHSSCLTSETLKSMDCDCVYQLNEALGKITKNKNGILFYLLQSGRGASYVCKSRGCQMVQYEKDKITTFEAYEKMGLRHDYRDYRNVKDICIIFEIENKNFYLMTNNPDKIKKLKELGINLKDIISVEFEPNPFNKKYLESKKNTGHILSKLDNIFNYQEQPSVKPFEPYHLPQKRFIHCSTYYLPIQPINNLIVLDKKPENDDYEQTGNDKYLIKSDDIIPYWFKVYVYYDIATHGEIMVLTYGNEDKIPIVRIHSEFIFNRFPLKDETYRNKYSHAVLESVKNGSGLIIVANHNGHDYNIGNYLLDKEKIGFEKTGISIKRNLLPITLLLKHHLNERPIKAFYSEESREEMQKSFKKGNIIVKDWISIDPNDSKGHYILQNRIYETNEYLLITKKPDLELNKFMKYLVTGIGSSEAHARYFSFIAIENDYNVKFITIGGVNESISKKYNKIIIFSQGLSPHGIKPIKYFNKKNIILFTSVTEDNNNKEKVELIKSIGKIIIYPMEDEYSILIRIIGPICCFRSIDLFFNKESNSLKNYYYIPDEFINSILEKQSITLIINYPLTEYYHNIKYKFIEGVFLRTVNVVDELSFAHGTFQNISKWSSCFILINSKNNEMRKVLKNYSLYEICSEDIVEIEHIINVILLKLVRRGNIDQINWAGKERQDIIYFS